MTAGNFAPASLIDHLIPNPAALSWRVVPVSDDYDPDATVIGDYTPVGDVVALTGVAREIDGTGWDLLADDPLLTGISESEQVEAVVLFIDTSDPSTSPVAAYFGRRGDTTAVRFEADGENYRMTWPAGYVLRL